MSTPNGMTKFIAVFLVLALSGCSSLEPGQQPKFLQGDSVVERLSGRVGIVQDGHYDPFSSTWKIRVRFVPRSYNEWGCDNAPYGNNYRDNSVWMPSYELRKADAVSDAQRTDRAPIGDTPESYPPSDRESPKTRY